MPKTKKTQHDDRNRPRARTLAVLAPVPLFRPRPCGGEHSFLRASHFLRAIKRMTSLAGRCYLVSLPTPRSNICPRQCQITALLGRAPMRTRRHFVNYGGWALTQRNVLTDKKKCLLLPSLLIIRENFRFLFLNSPDTRTARAQHVTKRKRITIASEHLLTKEFD